MFFGVVMKEDEEEEEGKGRIKGTNAAFILEFAIRTPELCREELICATFNCRVAGKKGHHHHLQEPTIVTSNSRIQGNREVGAGSGFLHRI